MKMTNQVQPDCCCPCGQNQYVHTADMLRLLTERGIIADQRIDNDRIRQAQQEKSRTMYHNTLRLLQNYRNIVWALECFPNNLAAELDQPFCQLDELLDRVDMEMGLSNRKLENRMESLRRSRLLIDRVNEALSVLKRKPCNGQRLYDLIYLKYISPDELSHTEILYRLDLSSRHFYRLRREAINVLAIRLWSAPDGELDLWLDILSLLESTEA